MISGMSNVGRVLILILKEERAKNLSRKKVYLFGTIDVEDFRVKTKWGGFKLCKMFGVIEVNGEVVENKIIGKFQIQGVVEYKKSGVYAGPCRMEGLIVLEDERIEPGSYESLKVTGFRYSSAKVEEGYMVFDGLLVGTFKSEK